ncbi:HEAT repeat domain-containing protein [Kitasatospora sp. NPDC054939]
MADGSATTPGHPSRTAILDAVHADRSGPVAVRLLRLAHADEPLVRREAMDLLDSANPFHRPWPEAVDAACARLGDPDGEVRRRAAQLVGYCRRPDLALALLERPSDPVVRTVLAQSLGPAAAPLHGDPLASVRFLANLAALHTAAPAQYPALDAALLADAREAALHLPDLGRRWGRVLCEVGRERHLYSLAARLLADPATRDAGAGLAREACHHRRAAPVVLLPLLARHYRRHPGPALADALTTALISRAARRTHAVIVAGLPFAPPPPPPRPPFGDQPAYDSDTAAALLAAKPVGIARLRHATAVFTALLDAGPLTFRQAAQLYGLTFDRPSRCQAECAPLWLRHAGPTVLPRLLALMTPHLDDYTIGEYYLAGLARMGHHARPALPAVTAMIDRPTRIPVNDSTADGETRLDECLLAAALHARHAILSAAHTDCPRNTLPLHPCPTADAVTRPSELSAVLGKFGHAAPRLGPGFRTPVNGRPTWPSSRPT